MKAIPLTRIFIFLFILTAASSGEDIMPRLHVDGPDLKDPAGNSVILRGLSIAELYHVMPSSEIGLENLIDMLTDTTDDASSSPGWYPRVIRIPVRPSKYLSKPDYYLKNSLIPAVNYVTERGLYAIIDWHYVDDTEGNIENTNQFWNHIAPVFKDYPNVMYEVYNEPIDRSGSWTDFRDLMQSWVDTIRDHAPETILLAGSPTWSQEVGDYADNPIDDNNTIYVAHIYPMHFEESWNIEEVNKAAEVHHVILTEWGFDNSSFTATTSGYGQGMIDWCDEQGMSWTAWCADNEWAPSMFDSEWNLRVGNNEMGGFVKDVLYDKRNDDRPLIQESSPDILIQPKPVSVMESGTAEFTIFSPEADSIAWYVNGSHIADSDKGTTRLTSLSLEQNSSVVHAEVFNQYGHTVSDTVSIEVTEFTGQEFFRPDATPVIDGEIDQVWDAVNRISLDTLVLSIVGDPEPSDLKAEFSALWDDEYFYFLFDVTDDTVAATGEESENAQDYDRLQLLIDAHNQKKGEYTEEDFIFSYKWGMSEVTEENGKSTEGIEAAQALSDNGYVMELKIPLDLLNYETIGENGTLLGFEVFVTDDDNEGMESIKSWYSSSHSDAMKSPSELPTVKLSNQEINAINTEPIHRFADSQISLSLINNSRVMIKSPENNRMKASIFDACGRIVDSDASSTGKLEIDISDFSEGVYIIRTTSGRVSAARRIIITGNN